MKEVGYHGLREVVGRFKEWGKNMRNEDVLCLVRIKLLYIYYLIFRNEEMEGTLIEYKMAQA
jgi:hypothetical protein